jgi:hypothetical protein
MTKSRVYFVMVVLLGLGFSMLIGCDALQTLGNYIPPCSIINCEQLGQVDYAQPRNLLIPDWPDYDKDPTCTIPGFCGPNIFYPNSTGSGGG